MTAWARRDELFVLWAAARADANLAYDAWCTKRTRDSYAVYRAFEDQADAAEGDLAALTEVLLAVS
jgi:hypothetical protein